MSRANIAWDVYRPSKKVYNGLVYWDTVYFTQDCDADYVRNSLVNHDGYPCDVIVRKKV